MSSSPLHDACSARPTQPHPLFGCNKGHVTPHLLVQHVLALFGDSYVVCPLDVYLAANKAAWKRKVLQDLQEETHFSSTELEVLLNHFQVTPQQLMPLLAAVAAGCSSTVALQCGALVLIYPWSCIFVVAPKCLACQGVLSLSAVPAAPRKLRPQQSATLALHTASVLLL